MNKYAKVPKPESVLGLVKIKLLLLFLKLRCILLRSLRFHRQFAKVWDGQTQRLFPNLTLRLRIWYFSRALP